MSVKNLGLIKAIHTGTTPPSNTMMLWYDTNTGVNKHKYYDVVLASWQLLNNTAAQSNYRSGRVIFSAISAQTVSFSSNLGSSSSDIVLTTSFYDSSGDAVTVKITNITISGFTATPSKIGTLHYHAFLKI